MDIICWEEISSTKPGICRTDDCVERSKRKRSKIFYSTHTRSFQTNVAGFRTIFVENRGANVRKPGVVSWYDTIATEMQWKMRPIRFRIASVQYGDKDFFVNDTFNDSLASRRIAFTDEPPVADQDTGRDQ